MKMRRRIVKSLKDELIKKSREAILAAVQIYNNPQITFRAESFITLSVIAWTYLMHAYYRSKGIDYRYFKHQGKRKRYDKTKSGAHKHWELERCISCSECPIDSATKQNLLFLIGIRHEIEHQMTTRIDEFISAKLQACAINYDYYLTTFFGSKYSVSEDLSLTIQFSSISPQQKEQLLDNQKIVSNVKNFITSFENQLSEDDKVSSRYAYRLLYVPISANREGQADGVVEFVKPGSELAGEISRVLVKETEKKKYRPNEIVTMMKREGFPRFTMHNHTQLWQLLKAKDKGKHYGVNVSKTWYWYDSWVETVRKHCQENHSRYH